MTKTQREDFECLLDIFKTTMLSTREPSPQKAAKDAVEAFKVLKDASK